LTIFSQFLVETPYVSRNVSRLLAIFVLLCNICYVTAHAPTSTQRKHRSGVKFDAARAAALARLLTRGEWTTVRQFRIDAGGGSHQDVAKALDAFRSELPILLAHEAASNHEVLRQMAILTQENARLTIALSDAEARFEGDRRFLMIETSRLRDELERTYRPNARAMVVNRDADLTRSNIDAGEEIASEIFARR
jgi:hypothetical protein